MFDDRRHCAAALSRRAFCGAILAGAWVSNAGAQGPERIAAIDWAMLETALALGVTPVAGSELRAFRREAEKPDVPAATVDLGLRGAPSFELLRMLQPDLILSSPFYNGYHAQLARLAPILAPPIHYQDGSTVALALDATLTVGRALGREAAAQDMVDDFVTKCEALATRHRALAPPVAVIGIVDSRHIRIFGPDSLFGSVLEAIGLQNSWQTATRFSPTSLVGVEALASHQDAHLAVVGGLAPGMREQLRDNRIWQALGPVREGRVSWLGPVNPYGALPAAERLGRRLARALRQADAAHG
ncbi:iron-siderophore ABC transporter substrate-binding protein [Pararhizobium haloflavum]|uniref:iron-siderophore ABC transporter substrate-binding protein n=1 Tax=Pararhizobium haloflavum TaxID=2037914 RepID=UPI000C17ECAB|nr:iron-siderophore ABC transporter substrate-binding protein [Pararhizobium haloflavum]